VIVPWEKGDVMLIDNRAVLHSRQPFTNFEDSSKHRRIMASLWSGRKNRNTKPFLGEGNASTLVLRSNDVMPKLGLGTWKIANNVTSDVVFQAIEIGYRHLDCASDYGNEKEVGVGIKRAIEAGIVTRKDLWVTSKLWNNYHKKEHVPLALARTLQDLGNTHMFFFFSHP
jgi:predicted aldo/keto reductase-like oxidoreductase